MFSFLNPFGGIASVAKIALIVGLLGSVLVTGYKVYDYVKVSEQNKIIVEQQQEALAKDQMAIAQMEADQTLRDRTIADQNQQLSALSDQLKGITDNLSDDSSQQAPNSIKQIIDRLRALDKGN